MLQNLNFAFSNYNNSVDLSQKHAFLQLNE